jgi:hypothetical protein
MSTLSLELRLAEVRFLFNKASSLGFEAEIKEPLKEMTFAKKREYLLTSGGAA